MLPLERIVLVAVCCLHYVMTSCPDVGREAWGANPPTINPLNLTLPVPFVVIHHTYIPSECHDTTSCNKAMRTMQHMHQIVNRWNDIGYNFAIGSNGQVYEGRGWDVVGAHAPKYNYMSIGICFIGDFRTVLPSTSMLEAAQKLIRCGVDRGSILANYTLVGHRQVRNTECPGGALFREIQSWPHWEAVEDIQPRVSDAAAAAATTTSTASTTTVDDDDATPSAAPDSENSVVPDANDLPTTLNRS